MNRRQVVKITVLVALMAIVFAVLVYVGVELFRARNKQCTTNDVERFWTDGNEEFNDFEFGSIGAFIRVCE